MLIGLQILQNLWLKSLICLFSSYLIGFFSIKAYINFVKKKQVLCQPIRECGPETHLKTKKNTPTMGGIFIVLSTLITALLFTDFHNRYVLVALAVFLSFAAIGLTDDLMKIFQKNSKGFRGAHKIVIQFAIIGSVFLWLGSINSIHFSSVISLPFGHQNYLILGFITYVFFVNIVIVGTANAVNLTDGLDGLASVPAVISLSCLIALIHFASNGLLAKSLDVFEVKFAGEFIFFCLALIVSILAFLTFNLKPAKIFMGDVGSLAIGSVLGLIAIILKQEFVFFIIALLFVAEAVSVILQVGSYKIRKKRIFLMAPLHHHYEKKGWSEEKVVRVFWAASAFFALVGLGTILIN